MADDSEWRNEANWHLGHTIYWSRRDPRLVVPKWYEPASTWTLNLARPGAQLAMFFILAPVAAILFLIAVTGE